MRTIVENYAIIAPAAISTAVPQGHSDCPKTVIFHILKDNSAAIEVLDIGFGTGSLGREIKINAPTRHWEIDGIDGFEPNCHNSDLLNARVYRTIWHGLAQEIPPERFQRYKIICLLDVIEHLPAATAKSLLRSLLAGMRDDAFLFVSTPLWFYPQSAQQEGDLEEHLIGVPATSMMALLPKMYSISPELVGAFVLGKKSLDFIEFFQPTTDRNFSLERGLAVANAINLQIRPGMLFTAW
jgi:2-polyprenyl-3-methyl-5-hydroxy-6-metoxy-1,4-benzoquinol methylase